MNTLLTLMVQIIMLFLILASVVSACRRVFARGLPEDEKRLMRRDLKLGAMAGAGLAVAQGVFIGLVWLASGGQYMVAMNLGVVYFIVACMVPVLWAAGRGEERLLNLPERHRWDNQTRLLVTAGIWLVGVVGAVVLFMAVKVEAGSAVEQLQKDSNPMVMGLVGLWMILNAPWMEELLFRHAALPQFANWMGGRTRDLWGSAVILSLVFALVHAGNMEPLWAKLVQTFVWGLGLAWVRINLGTLWAVGLHLAWNFASIGIAVLVMPEGAGL